MKEYSLFRIILLLEILCLIFLLLNKIILWWFIVVYIFLAFTFLFARFTLWGISDLFPKKYEKNQHPYTVIIPVKDEKIENFVKVLRGVIKQEGEKEILVGDDGSNVDIRLQLKPYEEILKEIKIIRNEKNIGKKEVQLQLIKQAKYNIIINIDSDIILKESNSLKKLVEPFGKNKVGVINGDIRIISNGSLLHRLQEYLYFCANHIGRKSYGWLGTNPSASGELLAFRKDIFMKFSDKYQNAYYLGEKVNFGEDRLLTNLFLKNGYDSIFKEDVIGYTFPRETYKLFIKQQLRWRKSGIRESIRCMKFAHKRNPLLLMHAILNFSLPIVFFMLIISLFVLNIFNLTFLNIIKLLALVITLTTVADLPLLFKEKRLFFMVVPFTLFNIFVITPLWTISLFMLTDNKWGTR